MDIQQLALEIVKNIVLIVSVLTLLISTLNLWFAHLKGPDIELSSDIKFELEDWKTYRAENVSSDFKAHSLGIAPLKMVFINNGSKAGAITKVEGEFIPEDDFKPFLKDSTFTNRVFNIDYGLPFSIGDGETRIIHFEGNIQTIDWTTDINPDIVKDTTQIRKDFYRSFEHNKKLFEEFVEYFDSKKDLGKISVYVEHSKKKLLTTKLRKIKVGESKLVNSCVVLSDMLKEQLSSWDTELITNSRLQNAPGHIDELLQLNEQNLAEFKRTPLFQCFIFENTLKSYKQNRNVIIDIMNLENGLMAFIEELDRSSKRHNLNIKIIQTSNSASEHLDKIDDERHRLLKLNNELHVRLEVLKKKISR